MKFTAPATLLAASVLSPLVSATAYLSYCQVSHSSNGNDFLIKVQSIPDVSKSSICGSSDRQIRSSAKGWSINVKYLTCDTGKTTPDMQILVKLDKQSPSTQRTALFNGLQAALEVRASTGTRTNVTLQAFQLSSINQSHNTAWISRFRMAGI